MKTNIKCGYAIKSPNGQFAGSGSIIHIRLKSGDRFAKQIKSIQYSSIINFTDGSKIALSEIEDFLVVK